ncbi:MAG: trypsin-like peptidase domain-containing protein [Planctomycetaceae bacterium]
MNIRCVFVECRFVSGQRIDHLTSRSGFDMTQPRHNWLLCLSLVVVMASLAASVDAAETEIPAARRTDTVRLIEHCLPAVVSVFVENSEGAGQPPVSVGSGSIIHPAGFVLTNDHVVRGFRSARTAQVLLSTGEALPMRVVARLVPEDLAILQVKTAKPLPTITLGRSHDIMLGEPALVIGTPGGLVHSVSTGIVSGVNRSTRSESNLLPWVIQTNAAVSPGNSGGPLINAVGEQIGVISTIGDKLQNVAFAIAVDHVREVLPGILATEQRLAFWCGVECEPCDVGAVVRRVEAGSPAETAGLRIGDRLRRLDEFELHTGVDLQLALVSHRRGDTVAVHYERDGQRHETSLVLGTLPQPKPVPDEGLRAGLDYAIYRGEWDRLPEFDSLTAERVGHCQRVGLDEISSPPDQFAVRFSGYIRIPKDEFYCFTTLSDDGSRLWIADRLVVDNDGQHAAREAGGFVRLPAGLLPFRLEYFEAAGRDQLEVTWEGGDLPKSSIPADVFLTRDESANKPDTPTVD